MTVNNHEMRLYSHKAERLYLNQEERQRFASAATQQTPETELLCLMLLHSGCRVSEALNMCLQHIQTDVGIVAIRSLKKRDKHHVREVPIPLEFARQLTVHFKHRHPNTCLWSITRQTAWRLVCRVMKEAGVDGKHATPKGLRHSFGVHCAFSSIPMPLSQRWLGHADIRTTAIYYQIVGREEIEMARRMWTSPAEIQSPSNLCGCSR